MTDQTVIVQSNLLTHGTNCPEMSGTRQLSLNFITYIDIISLSLKNYVTYY